MTRRRIRVVGAMIERDGHYLIAQRPPTASLPLLWEFPSGRVELDETDEAAVQRELHERLGIAVHVGERVMHVEHSYEDYDVDFRVFRCEMVSREEQIRHLRVHTHVWVLPGELDKYEFPAADQRTLEQLLELQ